ncbi:MAG: diguanylate cyclase [Magnetococcus sp. DMHC-1]
MAEQVSGISGGNFHRDQQAAAPASALSQALRAPRIVWLQFGFAIPFLLLIVGVGIWSLSTLEKSQNAATEDRGILSAGNQALDTARKAQVHFKIQVQEWKNILLRGSHPGDREKYLAAFNHQGQRVRELLTQLHGYFAFLKVGAREHTLLSRTVKSHDQLEDLYTGTLKKHDLSQPLAAHDADRAVRGMDRDLNVQMDELVDLVSAHVARMTANSLQQDQDRYRDLANRLGLVPSLLVFILTPLAFFLIQRLLIRPILEMTTTMTCISNGKLEKVVREDGCLELKVMARQFNIMADRLKNTLDGLRGEKNKLTTIILSAREGIVVTDREGVVVLVNPAAEQILGKTTAQIVAGGLLNMLDDPEYVTALLRCDDASVPDTVFYNNRMLVIHATTIRESQGQEIGSAAILRDVTSEKHLEEQLRRLSVTDGLTGLYNRRHMDDILRTEFERVRRFQHTLSIMLIDVDHFKKFNDIHGHDQGDRVLKSLAAVLQRQFREVDFPCRYGGEEFCVILPGTGHPGALQAAERLRKEVEATPVDNLNITISIGVAIYQHQYFTVSSQEDMLKKADLALYKAKESGRNRVCVSDQDDSADPVT